MIRYTVVTTERAARDIGDATAWQVSKYGEDNQKHKRRCAYFYCT
jgi:hypothetical protein